MEASRRQNYRTTKRDVIKSMWYLLWLLPGLYRQDTTDLRMLPNGSVVIHVKSVVLKAIFTESGGRP